MSVSIDDSVLGQLNTAEAKTLHDVSESLISCGVGKLVNLPQIIVVGDQSSGKSSVLEAISHVKFPVEGGLCTRFATELVLTQAPEMRVKVNIRFADGNKSSHCFQRADFSQDDLPEIIKEAKESMGLSGAGQEFSKDVLRIEIEGPKLYPLTLVDLPGLFHSDTETQSLGGKQTVDQLVEGYMKQKNSIILVVVTANQQLASHDALRWVKMFDPQRQRTIGVITKPDLSGHANETHYVRVAKNEEGANKLKYGWHVLRNRAEDEPDLGARDEIEERFFATGSWASLPKQDVGIASFRKKLSKVRYEHVRASLPTVVEDIESKLQTRRDALAQLGEPRSDPSDMRSFLLGVAGEFQRLARDGTYGRYNDPFFGGMDDEDRKLRALLRNFHRIFEHVVRTKGCQNHITEDGEPPEEEDLPEHLQRFLNKYPYAFDDPITLDVDDLKEQLEKQASANQGREFPGTANQELAIQLFQKQASPWKAIAEYHIEQVTLVAKSFVEEIFEHILGPAASNHASESILAGCVDPFFQETEAALKAKLLELLEPYMQGFVAPPDVELKRAIKEQSFGRLMDRLCDALEENRPDLFEGEYKVPLTRDMILQACNEEDIEDSEFGASKVVHMMLAYYEVRLIHLLGNWHDQPLTHTPSRLVVHSRTMW